MIVHFVKVGRNELSWMCVCKSGLSNEWLLSEVRKCAGIVSSDVEFTFDAIAKRGEIIVGGWRKVGEFEVLAEGARA